ncbi:hypothetical protein [Listeria seeligeri]|uniref:hypothetical protein n=1 Tax=Listeria seeligeri TaxID=1640 RepID=UPI001886AB86|nr:hypothetical protein [Listeria seeligeri]MBF2355986.1 hypothetical protein [Listeria seeligeri]MBF2375152.1 hypothetical protein [Listeria seeligeri]
MNENESLLLNMKEECKNMPLSNVIAHFQNMLGQQIHPWVIYELSKWVLEGKEEESFEVMTMQHHSVFGDYKTEIPSKKQQYFIKRQLDNNDPFVKFIHNNEEVWLNRKAILRVGFSVNNNN